MKKERDLCSESEFASERENERKMSHVDSREWHTIMESWKSMVVGKIEAHVAIPDGTESLFS